MEIVLKAQSKRQAINAENAVKVKAKYKGKSLGFNEVFIYQKGLKVVVYKSSL